MWPRCALTCQVNALCQARRPQLTSISGVGGRAIPTARRPACNLGWTRLRPPRPKGARYLAALARVSRLHGIVLLLWAHPVPERPKSCPKLATVSPHPSRASHASQRRAIRAPEESLQRHVEAALNALAALIATVSQRRRERRPGPLPKIEAHPRVAGPQCGAHRLADQRAIAAEQAAHFTPARRVGKTAIQDWLCKRRATARKG